jgi:hypothetical protein
MHVSLTLISPAACGSDALANRCRPGVKALDWLLENADWISSIDRDLGQVQSSWQAVNEMAALLGDVLAGTEPNHAALADARQTLPAEVSIGIVSHDQALLGLPWEMAHITWPRDKIPVRLCEIGSVVRVSASRAYATLEPMTLPLRILSIAPRPFGSEDVGISGTQSPLVAAAATWPHLLRLKLVRPSTWEALLGELRRADSYDILHFDGHGVRAADGSVALAFETAEDWKSLPVRAAELAAALKAFDLKLVILAACRSAGSSGSAVQVAGLYGRGRYG